MALYKEPIQAILDAITALNPGTILVKPEYTFGLPVVVAEDAKFTNTSLLITAKDSLTPYDGAVTIRYRRLPLSDLLQLVPTTIKANDLVTTIDLANRLNEAYGLNFTTDDIVDEPLTLVGGEGAATITAKPNSFGWLGSVTFQIAVGNYTIGQYLTVTALPGLYYPEQDITKPFGRMYSYWRNFSTVQADLLGMTTMDGPTITALKAALITVTGDAWVNDIESRYSLAGATILYNGITAGSTDLNPDYSHGLIVQLTGSCLGLSGTLNLHYNIPDEFGE